MKSSVPFGSVAEALGGVVSDPLATSPNWDFYKVRYHTPAGEITANYLYLAHDCPLREATPQNLSRWRSLAGSENGYTVVATTRSPLAANLKRTQGQFGGVAATTPRRLLYDNVLSRFRPAAEIEEPKYFVEPDVTRPNGSNARALGYLTDVLVKDSGVGGKGKCGVILVAGAGLGKTTLCRAVARRLLRPGSEAIPVLVESAQWRNLINLTLPNVLNAALLQLIPDAGLLTNAKTFQLLVREGLLVPIFDGFDELCLHPNSDYSPARLLTELLDLAGDTGAQILITVRQTFWEKYAADVSSGRIEKVALNGFSNDQRQRFFDKRLNDASERQIANRLAKELGRFYEKGVPAEPLQADRPSGVPLLLELVALYVEGNPNATFAPRSQDPWGPLLEAMCEREQVRQQLPISVEKQMSTFEELFRDFPNDISREALEVYVTAEAPEITSDALDRFESHAFFSPGQVVQPRFETLRVYFVARWLATKLEQASFSSGDAAISEILERNASGSSDVFDFLVPRFLALDQAKVRASIAHAVKMVGARTRWEGACSALVHLTLRLAHEKEQTKRGRTVFLASHLGSMAGSRAIFSKLAVQGRIEGLDLTDVTFQDCIFRDAEFRNCAFHESTEFSHSRFDGALQFENCERPGRAKVVDCVFSELAERSWDIQAGRASRAAVNQSVAKEALREVLRKFLGPFGFSSIKEIDRNSGAILKNPCRDLAWDEVVKARVVERHEISGVTGGGLHISEDQDVRHEVRNFLDNAALGTRLSGVLDRIVKKI
jgi:hypothetical protein